MTIFGNKYRPDNCKPGLLRFKLTRQRIYNKMSIEELRLLLDECRYRINFAYKDGYLLNREKAREEIIINLIFEKEQNL